MRTSVDHNPQAKDANLAHLKTSMNWLGLFCSGVLAPALPRLKQTHRKAVNSFRSDNVT